MAAQHHQEQSQEQEPTMDSSPKDLFSTYLGISFAIFLGFLPKSAISLVPKLQSHNRALSLKLFQAEEQLKQLLSRRKEDSKANARVVEIFASHRHGWQQEEKRLVHQIEDLRGRVEELEKLEDELKGKMEELKREIGERDEMLNFVTRRRDDDDLDIGGGGGGGGEYGDGGGGEYDGGGGGGGSYSGGGREGGYFGEVGSRFGKVRGGYDHDGGGGSYGGGGEGGYRSGGEGCYFGDVGSRFGKVRVGDERDNFDVRSVEECYVETRGVQDHHNVEEFLGGLYGGRGNGFNSAEFSNLGSKFWAEKGGNLWQDVQYESVESVYDMKHYVARRRESPWKVDGDSSGVSSKLKLLEQELLNLERIGTSDPSKVPSLMRKQAKRYQALAGKIDDLCRRMQASDPCEPNISPEFRAQRQTEFLLEAFGLQQRASETAQKLTALQTETGKGYFGDDLEGQAKLTTRRSLFSIRNNFREIQRNLEIWLARIIGDVEGILARDGASRVKDFYISRYPFIQ